MSPVSKEDVMKALSKVIDPEIGVNIVDLGLVYGIEVEGNTVKVKMTLTTPMCPLGPMIVDNARKEVEQLEGVDKAEVEVVFDPPWSIERIKPEVRERLGLGV